jgi:Fic family protein
MRIPKKPPGAFDVMQKAISNDINLLSLFAQHSNIVDAKGRYFHWDQLRFRPPPQGLTSAHWWAAIRSARHVAGQPLSLIDAQGNRFTFCEPAQLKAALREIDMNAGGALGSDVTAPSVGEGRTYLARSLAEEPFASSFIEGAATTRQIAKKLIFEGRSPRTKDERMVLNNYMAMQFIKTHSDQSLTMEMLLELHYILTVGTMDDPNDCGRIRTNDDVQVVDETTGEVLHQPPPATDLKTRLNKLISFANKKHIKGDWIHPLEKAFILHFMLSYEHPFVDGNGRVARALFYWAALREGYWLIEYISISSVIAESTISYGRAFLYVETDEGDLTYFFIYHAKILTKAVERLTEYVDRKRKEVKALENRLNDKGRPDAFNHRQSWILNEFARNRLHRLTIAEHEKRNAISYLTARKDLEELVSANCLQKRRVGKSSMYFPVHNLLKVLTAA